MKKVLILFMLICLTTFSAKYESAAKEATILTKLALSEKEKQLLTTEEAISLEKGKIDLRVLNGEAIIGGIYRDIEGYHYVILMIWNKDKFHVSEKYTAYKFAKEDFDCLYPIDAITIKRKEFNKLEYVK